MPPAEDIQRYLTGAWRMMNGKADGLRLLDLSADGFWDSFFAIVLALPAFIVSWVAVAGSLEAREAVIGTKLSLMLRLAMIDVTLWILPLVALAAVAKPIGIQDRFAAYVVSTNWSGALLIWLLLLPPSLLMLFTSATGEVITALSLALSAVSLVLNWRLVNIALGKGPAMTTAIIFASLVFSVVMQLSLNFALRLTSIAG